MNETILTVVAGIVFIIGPFVLIAMLDKRTKKHGFLFSGKVTLRQRIWAIVLGILLGAITIYMISFMREVSLLFLFLAVILIGYGFGGNIFMKKLQSLQGASKLQPTASDVNTQEPALAPIQEQTRLFSDRLLRFLLRIGFILIVSGLFLAGCWWAATHSDSPWAIVFVIAVVIFFVLARILDMIGFIRRWFK